MSSSSNFGDDSAAYVKGHVTKAEFQDALRRHCGDHDIPPEDIHHVYARLIPVMGRDYDHEFKVSKPGRGAFAATFHGWAMPDGAWRCPCPECVAKT